LVREASVVEVASFRERADGPLHIIREGAILGPHQGFFELRRRARAHGQEPQRMIKDGCASTPKLQGGERIRGESLTYADAQLGNVVCGDCGDFRAVHRDNKSSAAPGVLVDRRDH
jgi:hypothetical protein